MKLTQKHLRLISGFCILLAAVISILSRNYNNNNPENNNNFWYWLSIAIMFIALILLVPWIKDKKNSGS